MTFLVDFTSFAYLVSTIIAVAVLVVAVITCFQKNFDRIPKALRLYLKWCYLPFVIIIAFLTLSYSIFFIFISEARQAIIVLNILLPFTTQVMRSIFLTIIFERIFATIFSANYNLSHKPSCFMLLTVVMCFMSFAFIGFFELNLSLSTNEGSLQLFAYTVLSIHIIIIVGFTVLYLLNKRKYKVTAYRTTLKKRHQIFENVKVLSYLFPSILIFTMLAPWGALIMSIGFFFSLPTIPLCIYHIFHNLPHLFICLQFKTMNRIKGIYSRNMVEDIMEKDMQVIFNTNRYFENLRLQWN